MKRIVSALLLFALLLSSCGQAAQTAETVTLSEAESLSETETAPETELKDNVPQLDFEGDTITYSTTEAYHYEFDVEELTGEVTNDAIYQRNLMIEERFNVNIEKTVTDQRDQQTALIRKAILSNDHAFDVAAHFVYLAGGLILEDLSSTGRKSLTSRWISRGG